MRITRRRPTVEWTQVPNAVARDHRLSWRARGLLLELLSYPPGWEVTIDDLVKQAARHSSGATEGRDAMRKAARELKDVGYLIEHKSQDERGRWRTDLELTDAPMWALVNAQLDLDPAEDDRRRISSHRFDLQEHDVSAGDTDDGFPVVGSPVVGFPGVSPKKVPKKEAPDPEEAEAPHTEDKPAPATAGVSAEMLRQAAEIAARLDLARLDAQPRQRIQITHALAEALARPDADAATVERYAAAKVAEGHTVKYLLGAFEPARLTVGLPAYRTGPAPQAPAERCTTHPGAPRRADGECAGCWVDRMAAADGDVA